MRYCTPVLLLLAGGFVSAADVKWNFGSPPAANYAGDLPPHPPQPGMEWKRYQGEVWKQYKVTAVPAVTAAAPFPQRWSGNTPTTDVLNAVINLDRAPAPGSFAATPARVIYTIAPGAVLGGHTNCPPSG